MTDLDLQLQAIKEKNKKEQDLKLANEMQIKYGRAYPTIGTVANPQQGGYNQVDQAATPSTITSPSPNQPIQQPGVAPPPLPSGYIPGFGQFDLGEQQAQQAQQAPQPGTPVGGTPTPGQMPIGSEEPIDDFGMGRIRRPADYKPPEKIPVDKPSTIFEQAPGMGVAGGAGGAGGAAQVQTSVQQVMPNEEIRESSQLMDDYSKEAEKVAAETEYANRELALAMQSDPELKQAYIDQQESFDNMVQAGFNRNDILKKFADEIKVMQSKYKESERELDPRRFWKNRSAYKNAMAGLGLLLGGISKGLVGGENPALRVIENAIAQDIEAQKYNREQAWKDAQRMGDMMDKEVAIQDAMVANSLVQYKNRLENVNKQLERLEKSGNIQNARQKAAAAQFSMDVKEKLANIKLQIGNITAKRVNRSIISGQAGGATAKALTELQKREKSDREEYQKSIKDSVKTLKSFHEVDKFLALNTGAGDKSAIQRIAKMFDPSGVIRDSDVQYWAEINSKVGNAFSKIRQLADPEKFSQSQKKELLQALKIIRDESRSHIDKKTKFYTDLSRRYGGDPRTLDPYKLKPLKKEDK